MLSGLLILANGLISVCYFIIAFLILMPFLRGEQKTSLVLATICIFFSCALGHGSHVLMMLWDDQHLLNHSPFLLKVQVGIDSLTAAVAVTYIALRRYFSFLVDAPLLLTQAQARLEVANKELKELNTRLESLVTERTQELSLANQELLAKDLERKEIILALKRSNAFLKAQQETGVDGILVVNEMNKVVHYNQNFSQIWQIPESLMEQGDDRKILELVVTKPQNGQEFIDKVNYLYQHPQINSRDEVVLKDGRTLDRYTAPIYSEGIYYGRIWYFRDITDSKLAQEQLRQSNAKDPSTTGAK
jgi:transcriptional regulator with PAS, ATPase and Fis domain